MTKSSLSSSTSTTQSPSSIPEHSSSSSNDNNNNTTTNPNPNPTESECESESDSPSSSSSPTCPFCTIISNFPPVDPSSRSDPANSNPAWNADKLDPPSYVLLSTEHVVAFLDIAPLTRGHVLVTPRTHRVKVGDLSELEMAEVGRLLPLLARSVIKAVLPDIPHGDADYNIVQNNGPGAAQVVPHVHFHIVPRPPFNYQPPTPPSPKSDHPNNTTTKEDTPPGQSKSESKIPPSPAPSPSPPQQQRIYPASRIPSGIQRSYIQFGRGSRQELDEDDAVVLAEEIRRLIALEFDRPLQMIRSDRIEGGMQTKTKTKQKKRVGKL